MADKFGLDQIEALPLMQFDLRSEALRIVAAPHGGVYIDFPALATNMELGFFRINLPIDATERLRHLLKG